MNTTTVSLETVQLLHARQGKYIILHIFEEEQDAQHQL
jgi:hypothetical protein